MKRSEKPSSESCICPNDRCHLGRSEANAKGLFCDECIGLWFNIHLKHRIRKVLEFGDAESVCIAIRNLLQFLGLGAKVNPSANNFQLIALKNYWSDRDLARMRMQDTSLPKVTYEVRADNIGGKSFTSHDVEQYSKKHPQQAKLLARFIFGVNTHTAHLTWGANHSTDDLIWDINTDPIMDVVRPLFDLLGERVYMDRWPRPWDSSYRYRYSEGEQPFTNHTPC